MQIHDSGLEGLCQAAEGLMILVCVRNGAKPYPRWDNADRNYRLPGNQVIAPDEIGIGHNTLQ